MHPRKGHCSSNRCSLRISHLGHCKCQTEMLNCDKKNSIGKLFCLWLNTLLSIHQKNILFDHLQIQPKTRLWPDWVRSGLCSVTLLGRRCPQGLLQCKLLLSDEMSVYLYKKNIHNQALCTRLYDGCIQLPLIHLYAGYLRKIVPYFIEFCATLRVE